MGDKLCGHPAIREVIEVSTKWVMPMRDRLSHLVECREGKFSTDPGINPDK